VAVAVVVLLTPQTVPQAELLALLEASGIGEESAPVGTDDCSITPTAIEGVWLAQTTDFFYPLVDDPYVMVSLIERSLRMYLADK
jgi:hypothetical protein